MIDKIFKSSEMGTCFGFLFVSIMLLFFLREIYLWIISFTWTETKGKIISSRREDWGLDQEVQIRIEYQFNVDGVTYTSKKIRYLEFDGPFEPSWFSDYEDGMDVKVYFNPNKPSQSILIKKFSIVNIVMYLFVCITLAYGVLILTWVCDWHATIEFIQNDGSVSPMQKIEEVIVPQGI